MPQKQWSPKQKTEANAPMQESEEHEGYSSGYNSEEKEGYSSGYNSEEREGYSSGYNSDEAAAHMKKAGDFRDTSLVDGKQSCFCSLLN